MLLRFMVENYLSFKDETVFDMFPTGLKELPDHVNVDNIGKKVESLPVTVIYGANASGKSNLITAVHFASQFIVKGVGRTDSIPVISYRLDSQTRERPSRFEFTFKTNGVIYVYGFSLTREAVDEEWLSAFFSNRETVIFERKLVGNQYKFLFGKRLKKRDIGGADASVPSNMLLLTFVHNNEILRTVYDWFSSSLDVVLAECHGRVTLAERLNDSTDLQAYVSKVLLAIDTGIESIKTRKTTYTPVVKATDQSHNTADGTADLQNDKHKLIEYEIFAEHTDSDGKKMLLPFWLESAGTWQMTEILSHLYTSNGTVDKVVVVDEIDRCLHPALSCWLLKYCVEKALPLNGKFQCIFTTHDTRLLKQDFLRRDEIWFVDKGKEGSSLSRLSEFKVPDDKIGAVEEGYFDGRFGGIPYLKEMEEETNGTC